MNDITNHADGSSSDDAQKDDESGVYVHHVYCSKMERVLQLVQRFLKRQ